MTLGEFIKMVPDRCLKKEILVRPKYDLDQNYDNLVRVISFAIHTTGCLMLEVGEVEEDGLPTPPSNIDTHFNYIGEGTSRCDKCCRMINNKKLEPFLDNGQVVMCLCIDDPWCQY